MRFFKVAAAALAVSQGAQAIDIQKAIIMTFPKDTADDIVNRAMADIRDAGGVITHEYKIIKGFAAKAPQKILDTVRIWSSDYHAVIEEDQMVEISGTTTH
ncbi:hypothetical protein GGS20DRAFT_590158 [Poronia punctata]|nr:hypothetical protein GGS20DRAFT_590158 [Poronia punctata]